MKKSEIVVGNEYLAKVSGTLQRVRIGRAYEAPAWDYNRGHTKRCVVTRWAAVNLATGRAITIKSAQRLRPIPAAQEGPEELNALFRI